MALSGTINNTFRTGYAVRVIWEITSQSVANNSSNVTARVQLVSLGSSYTINSTATKNGSLTINGTKYNFTFTAGLTGNQTKTLYTKSVTVPHNADGTKTCSFIGVAGIDVTLSGVKWTSVTAQGNGTFDTIARASTISSVTSSVSVNGTNAVTVSIARASSSFTHTVVYKFGSYTQTQTGIGTSTSYVIPQSWLNAMPNATSGKATVTISTYSGSSKIGASYASEFTLTAPNTVLPTISSITINEAQAGIFAQFGGYVQNKSRAAVSISATGVYSSKINSIKTTIDGVAYSNASFTSGILKNSGARTISVIVTDSRGRTATTTRTITVIAYTPPKINIFSGYRATSAGVENYDGTYLNTRVKYAISPVNNRNTHSYSIQYKMQAATSWSTLRDGTGYNIDTNILSGAILGLDSSYNIRLTIRDYFSTISQTYEVPTAFTLIDYNKSGRGLAFGKVSELAHGVEFGLPAYFSNGETPSSAIEIRTGTDLNSLLQAGFYNVPSTEIWNTLTNKPATSVATGTFIVTSAGGGDHRCQLYIRGGKLRGGLWERQYYSGSWGDWKCIYNGGGQVLWSGALYMTAGHTAELSEKVSEQPTGIVLVFSRYSSGTAQNYHYNHFFVSKAFVNLHAGVGSQFLMTTDGTFSVMASKYLYIHDDRIVGNAVNNSTGTASGITYNNAGFVLRYVIGV